MKIFATAACQDVGLCRVDGDTANVVRVSLKLVNSLQSVVIEHTDLHVILNTRTHTHTFNMCSKQYFLRGCCSVITVLTAPATIQCFLDTNLATLTGRSHSSKVFTIVYTH